jgi:hypothetical protein
VGGEDWWLQAQLILSLIPKSLSQYGVEYDERFCWD